MEPGRCRRLVPLTGLVLSGVLALGGTPLLAAGPWTWTPAECGGDGSPPGGAPPGEAGSWYRTDPVLDSGGTLAGVRLMTGGATGPGRLLELEPEAFASGPVRGRVVVGEDDGTRSVVRAMDPGRGCETVIATVRRAVVRSAVASADGSVLYEHRVGRRTRTDLGVWRRELHGWRSRGAARRVLDPLPPDAVYGPTFTTGLTVTPGGELVVASCGERACRTRILLADGGVRAFGPTGPAIGAAGGALIAREACTGLPCPIVLHEPGGARRMVAADARRAALGGAGGHVLVVEGAGGRVRAVDVRTGLETPVATGGLVPVGGGSLATSGASSAPGEILLAPDGRVTGATAVRRVLPVVEEVLP